MSLLTSLAAADFPAPASLPVQAELPDPLVAADGSRVVSRNDWAAKRAPELRAQFAHYMYGERPGVLAPVTGRLLREDKAAFGGKATLREVEISCGLKAPVHLLVVIPNRREKPAACFLGMNFRGNYQLLDDPLIQLPKAWGIAKTAADNPETSRGKDKEVWNLEQSIDRGYAVATFHSRDVVPDEKELAEEALQQFRTKKDGERGPADTATIMAWAWGFSRMLDYLETVPEIDAKRVAVVGHSRNGKTALLAAAMDERIALAIPSQAGCGGTAPSRVSAELAAPGANGRPTAETVAVINRSFPHWFCGNFKQFNDAVDKLPFDQHALIALCAPRPVLLSNATEDLWANPDGQFAMLKAAAPVYAFLGAKAELPAQRPEVSQLLNTRLGYFIRPGKHAMTTLDWKAWLDYADQWLK